MSPFADSLTRLRERIAAGSERRIGQFETSEVTTRSGDEIDPASVGMTRSGVEAIWQAVLRLYRTGIHPAISICVRRRGAVVLKRAVGHARGNGPDDALSGERELVAATPDTLFNLFSSGKPVICMLTQLLVERGEMRLDDPIVRFIPEFGRRGKGEITLRHLLTHRAGISELAQGGVTLDELEEPDAILDRVYALEPTSPPGSLQAYHAITGGFVLAELIRRVDGRDARAFLADELTLPMNLEGFGFGVAADDDHRAALESFTGFAPPRALDALLLRNLGVDAEGLVETANDLRFRRAVIPSANIFCTADEATRFYDMLMARGDAPEGRIFAGPTVDRALTLESRGFDGTIRIPIRYGLGFMLGGPSVGFYGLRTPRAFGHPGYTNTIAFADPDRGLSFAMLSNGKPLVTPGFLQYIRVMITASMAAERDGRLA